MFSLFQMFDNWTLTLQKRPFQLFQLCPSVCSPICPSPFFLRIGLLDFSGFQHGVGWERNYCNKSHPQKRSGSKNAKLTFFIFWSLVWARNGIK